MLLLFASKESSYSGVIVFSQVDWITAIKTSNVICFRFSSLPKIFLSLSRTFSITFKSLELVGQYRMPFYWPEDQFEKNLQHGCRHYHILEFASDRLPSRMPWHVTGFIRPSMMSCFLVKYISIIKKRKLTVRFFSAFVKFSKLFLEIFLFPSLESYLRLQSSLKITSAYQSRIFYSPSNSHHSVLFIPQIQLEFMSIRAQVWQFRSKVASIFKSFYNFWDIKFISLHVSSCIIRITHTWRC